MEMLMGKKKVTPIAQGKRRKRRKAA